jgi:hypothetical protein
MLELTHVNPDWFGALSSRWSARLASRSADTARIRDGSEATPSGRLDVTDDLAWLRVAFCNPELHGLYPLSHEGAVTAWAPDDDAVKRLRRLRDRAILEAAASASPNTKPPTLTRSARS